MSGTLGRSDLSGRQGSGVGGSGVRGPEGPGCSGWARNGGREMEGAKVRIAPPVVARYTGARACVCGWVLPPKAAWPTACAAVLVCVCKGADARLYLLQPLVLVATSDGDGHVMAT